ncbi:MAG: glycosyltransferase family 4 protein [Ignavibacteriales bacterium]|nr:glycosyltransferase family 4 protein [Ignavibacteriales bacterium]
MVKILSTSTINHIAFIGNYEPRQCGIATFTTDLCESISSYYPETSCIAIPVNDVVEGYDYPSRVRFELQEKDIDTYLTAADFLNIYDVDVVCLQFEYGIFGGKAGRHIIPLLRELRMPVVTTLHTILKNPDPDQLSVLQEIASLSERLIVMSEKGRQFLEEIYKVPPEKIDMIHHGIPDIPFVDPSFNKDLFGVEGKTVILSFGLLSSSKGIETVISALPEIIKYRPETVYMVVGATHPHVIQNEGETYRLSLQRLAKQKGVEKNVIFYNRFVTIDELIEFIGAADIYITPYLNEAQITSGTLAYTMGAGKAVISTPYWYAEELLAEGRGVITPFKDSDALAKQVINLLDNEAERHAMRKRAYLFGRKMIWSEVAQKYMESFERARSERRHFIPAASKFTHKDKHLRELPPIKLDHFIILTDDTGIFQHALFTVPNYAHGYTTDDNARALLVANLLEQLGIKTVKDLTYRYLAFLGYAFNDQTGRFRNFMDYQRRWLEDTGSEDSLGRSLLALGTWLRHSNTAVQSNTAGWLYEQTLPAILATTSPRAWAFSLIGIYEYLQKFAGDRRANNVRDELAQRIFTLYKQNSSKKWRWFEQELSYCNPVLSQALILSGVSMKDKKMLKAGIDSLTWLANLQHSKEGYFVPIGSNGFYKRGGECARFDQQPVEAQAMISASIAAFDATGDPKWKEEAFNAFEWFLGNNDLNLMIYDPITGGCRDGLHPDRVNENQGSESTLAYLQALLELRLFNQSQLLLEATTS